MTLRANADDCEAGNGYLLGGGNRHLLIVVYYFLDFVSFEVVVAL
jgi:hypothetical protein